MTDKQVVIMVWKKSKDLKTLEEAYPVESRSHAIALADLERCLSPECQVEVVTV